MGRALPLLPEEKTDPLYTVGLLELLVREVQRIRRWLQFFAGWLLVGAAIALLFALAACARDFTAPEAAVRFDPPEVYRTWWAEVEGCSGLTGDFGRVRWFQVGDEETWNFQTEAHGGVSALWVAPHTIYLAGAYVGRPDRVRHEMLHDLTASPHHSNAAWENCIKQNLVSSFALS